MMQFKLYDTVLYQGQEVRITDERGEGDAQEYRVAINHVTHDTWEWVKGDQLSSAVKGLTPQEMRSRRAIYNQARRILTHPSTRYEWNPGGYLERVEFRMGGSIQVIVANWDNGPLGDMFYVLFDEVARLMQLEKEIGSPDA